MPHGTGATTVAAGGSHHQAPEGLVWVSDAEPGIRRLRQGRGFAYRSPSGRSVSDEATLERIRRLAIPPAYEDVWICRRGNGHLQATGRDARGRKQYRYHARWQAERGAGKFDQLRSFGLVLPRIRAQVGRDLAGATGPQPTMAGVLATLVRLLDTTFVRIGNDAYARENGSFGLTTLRNRHAEVRGSEVCLSFSGKSGRRQQVHLDDPRVATVVKRCRQLPGYELFQYVDDGGAVHRLGSADVNDYLAAAAQRRVTAKDFRTWHGTVLALQLTLEATRPNAEPGAGTVAGVLGKVAQKLGNTPAVCRKAYVHPAVLSLINALGSPEAGQALSKLEAKLPKAPGLSIAERRLLRLLASGFPTTAR